MAEGIVLDRIRWKYGLNGVPERTLTAYVNQDTGAGTTPLSIGNGQVSGSYSPSDPDTVVTIEEFANWVAHGLTLLLDNTVNISGIIIERMSDPQTVIGVIPCALAPVTPSSRSTAGVNGQFGGIRGYTVSGTISRRRIFGVSGLVNTKADTFLAQVGSPTLAVGEFGDFISRFNGTGLTALDGFIQHYAVTRVEDTDLEFTPVAGNFGYLVNHNVDHRARRKYTY